MSSTSSDPQVWNREIWNICAATVDLASDPYSGQPTRFQLTPPQGGGQGNTYQVEAVESAQLPDCFKGSTPVILTQGGTESLTALQGGRLPVFGDTTRSKYWDASHDVLSAANLYKDRFAHLKATISWRGSPHVVLLYQVPKALMNGKTFLVMRIKQPDGTASPDGWAVGNN
jgi:hypothetical protein